MKNCVKIVLAVGILTFLSSCAGKFSKDQRAQLSSLRLDATSQAEEAYRDPQGAAAGTGAAVTNATGGGLIGALIGEIVVASQNHSFKKNEKQNFAALKQVTPSSVAPTVGKELEKVFSANPFFASRMNGQSPNRVVSEVTFYSLTRTGKANGEILMSPSITADIKIVGPDQKGIGSGWTPVTGVSSMSYPVSYFVSNPSVLGQGFGEAARNLGAEFSAALAKRTAN